MFEQIPADRGERWRLMRTIIGQWMRPLTEADSTPVEELDEAEKRLGCSLPLALREWYQLAGRAKDIWSWQDKLLAPRHFYIHDGVMVFCVENQMIWSMGIRVDQL